MNYSEIFIKIIVISLLSIFIYFFCNLHICRFDHNGFIKMRAYGVTFLMFRKYLVC